MSGPGNTPLFKDDAVSGAETTPPDATARALQRLANAVERLESAASHAASGDLLLAGELRDLRDDYARLDDASRVAATRLDTTMARLRDLLEE